MGFAERRAEGIWAGGSDARASNAPGRLFLPVTTWRVL